MFQIITRARRTSLHHDRHFPDPRLVAAIVDRVTFNAHVLEPAPSSTGCAPARPLPDANAGSDLPRWQAERVPDQQEQIRPARLDDAEDVWPLARDFATSFTPERSAFDDTWRRLINSPGTLLLVAEADEYDIVGYLLGNSHLTFLANGPVAWVEEVMVTPSSRRTGVGRRLMEHAEGWARDINAGYLALAVDEQDPSTPHSATKTPPRSSRRP